ncbi:MAG TPA: hypothetical protein VE869_06615 [Gemmatimonas sp.]|nr:hypothetical protein [Gemmatimonas sp.]
MISRSAPLLLVAVISTTAPLGPLVAQAGASTSTSATVRDFIARGDGESAARRPAAALVHYKAALAIDARSYDALWRASREAVDLAEFEKDSGRRTRLNGEATEYAKRAVGISPGDAEGHFALSRALGRTALAAGIRDRVKYAKDIRTHALRALELQARHPGALHVMGVWNAEVMRLNGMQRTVARTFLGGEVFGSASWAEATRYMELSVAAEPNRLVHQLDLARVYRDTKRTADARTAFQAALRAPLYDANDEIYRRTAEQELRALK